MNSMWLDNRRRARRMALQAREDLLRRQGEAASREASAVGHDAVSGSAGIPSAGEPERVDVSLDAEDDES